jgi:tetratricopeptide (TPR) repeat protein
MAPVGWSAAFSDVTDALAKAETLYYDADFTKVLEVLLPVDELLKAQPDQKAEKIGVKLQLALAYIGLNDYPRAKTYFRELYDIDGGYAVDRQRYSPKVLTLADEARAEHSGTQCLTTRENANRELESGNLTAVVSLLASTKSRCPNLAEIELEAAELMYEDGLESYRKGDFAAALRKFRNVQELSPRHELAVQYVELTENKLQVTAERLFLSWNMNFRAGEFKLAAADYRQLTGFTDPTSTQMVNQARTEYQKALAGMVQDSNRACASGDAATVTIIKNQISEMLPDPSIGEDILPQLADCVKKECMQMSTELILTRLRTRVDVEILPSLRSFLRGAPATILVHARIDEKGDVVSATIDGGNPALNQATLAAVTRWKFTRVLDADGPRCVDTELPLVITP